MKRYLLLAPLALAACQAAETDIAANDTGTANMQADTAPMPDTAAPRDAQMFVNAVAASDAFEIASAEAAAPKLQSAELRDFAQQMIADHSKSTADLRATAQQVAPDPTMTAEQNQMLEALRAAPEAEIDALYREQQLTAHQQALQTLSSYAQQGSDPGLQQFAQKTAPVVEGHLQMLQSM